MATRKPKRTAELGQKLDEKLRGKGVKVKHYNVNPKRLGGSKHAYTDGRSSDILKQQSPEYATTKNGRLGVVQRDENGNKTGVSTKNAMTNLFTVKNSDGTKSQSGTHKVNGRSVSQANRRTRDYYTRVGLNNDQRSPEALARLEATLRANGASEDEITALTGRGNGNPAPWRAVSTG